MEGIRDFFGWAKNSISRKRSRKPRLRGILFDGQILQHDVEEHFELTVILTTQVALLPVSPVSPVVVLTAPVRPLSVTCAVPVACSPPPRSGASGTSRSTRARSTCYQDINKGKNNHG